MNRQNDNAAGLAIGPANFAGQAYRWASAVNATGRARATSFSTASTPPWRRPGYTFPVHHRLPHHRISTSMGKRARMGRILRNVSHVAIDGFLPLYSPFDKGDLAADVHRLRARGVVVALIAHGTDVRDPDAHMARVAHSHFTSAPADYVSTCRAQSKRNREIAADLGVPVFVSTPDLLNDITSAHWLPLCVDVHAWAMPAPALQRDQLRVLHLPSRRRPPIKGTAVIDPVLRRMAAEGLIQYLAPEAVDNAKVPALLEECDVVVEQIMIGSYGVAAVEAMAAGRLVVGYVDAGTRAAMPEGPPIVDAPPQNFEEVMRDIVARPQPYEALGASGPGFAARWHSGTRSAESLVDNFAGRRTGQHSHRS